MSSLPHQSPVDDGPYVAKSDAAAVAGPTNPPQFKDQMREGAGAQAPSIMVPIVSAALVTESQLSDEERLRLERENLQLQQRNVELERRQLELENQRQQHQHQSPAVDFQSELRSVSLKAEDVRNVGPNTSPVAAAPTNILPSPTNKKPWIKIGMALAVLLILALAAVAGICAFGDSCGGGKGSKNQPVVSPPATAATSASPTALAPAPPTVRPPTAQTVPVPTVQLVPRTTMRPVLSTTTTAAPTAPLPDTSVPPLPPAASEPIAHQPVSLTTGPTLSPVLEPVPTSPPAVASVPVKTTTPSTTTGSSDRANSVLSFINAITLSGQTLRYLGSDDELATAEEKALRWLIDEDTNSTSPRAWRQRYVLATVWYQNGVVAALKTWTSWRPECEWRYTICVNGDLTVLRLVGGEKAGPLPADIGLLTTLTDLSWGTRTTTASPPLTGTIPSSLGLLTRLTRLNLPSNQLTGRMPSSLAALTALNELALNDNRLTDIIPSSLLSLTALTKLYMYNNQLSGAVPFCDGSIENGRFTSLETDCNEVACPCCTACCPGGGWDGIPSRLNGCDA